MEQNYIVISSIYIKTCSSYKMLFIKRSKYDPAGEVIFVCVEVLRPSQPSGVMSSAVSLPNHTFTGQA